MNCGAAAFVRPSLVRFVLASVAAAVSEKADAAQTSERCRKEHRHFAPVDF